MDSPAADRQTSTTPTVPAPFADDEAPAPEDVSLDDFLAKMAADQAREDAPEVGPRGGLYLATGGVRPRPRLRYSHKAMADLILMRPDLKQYQIASIFGKAPNWVSTVITSDAFQAYLAKRQAELIDPEITLSLRERANAMATRSMQVLQEKLTRPADQVPDALALRAFELAAKAIGMGGNAAPPPAADPASYLPALAERLTRLRSGAAGASDAVVVNG